jgi:hypothetical protein
LHAWCELGNTNPGLGVVELLQSKKKKPTVWRFRGVGACGTSMIAKYCHRDQAFVERLVYRDLLPKLSVPSLRWYGLVHDGDGRNAWLYMEDAAGEPYSPVDPVHRALAAQWLSRVHALAVPPESVERLPDAGPARYESLLEDLLDLAALAKAGTELDIGAVRTLEGVIDHCERLLESWSSVFSFCEQFPRTLVHGSLSRRNMRVRTPEDTPVLMVFDWGAAGYGVPARDLAKLVGSSVGSNLHEYRQQAGVSRRMLETGMAESLVVVGRLFRAIEHLTWTVPKLQYEWVRPEEVRKVRELHAELNHISTLAKGTALPFSLQVG